MESTAEELKYDQPPIPSFTLKDQFHQTFSDGEVKSLLYDVDYAYHTSSKKVVDGDLQTRLHPIRGMDTTKNVRAPHIVILEEVLVRRKKLIKDKTRHTMSLLDIDKMQIIARAVPFEYWDVRWY